MPGQHPQCPPASFFWTGECVQLRMTGLWTPLVSLRAASVCPVCVSRCCRCALCGSLLRCLLTAAVQLLDQDIDKKEKVCGSPATRHFAPD